MTTTCYVRSSVVGGAVFTEIDGQGNKSKGYVYALGMRLAEQYAFTGAPSYVVWRQTNPVTGTLLKSSTSGVGERNEFDPSGAEVGNTDPYYSDPTPTYIEMQGNDPLYLEYADPFNLVSGCILDGLPISCSQLYRLAESGSVTDENGANVITLPGGVIVRGVFGDRYVNGDYAGEKLIDIGSLWLPLTQQQGQRGGQRGAGQQDKVASTCRITLAARRLDATIAGVSEEAGGSRADALEIPSPLQAFFHAFITVADYGQKVPTVYHAFPDQAGEFIVGRANPFEPPDDDFVVSAKYGVHKELIDLPTACDEVRASFDATLKAVNDRKVKYSAGFRGPNRNINNSNAFVFTLLDQWDSGRRLQLDKAFFGSFSRDRLPGYGHNLLF
jgi:hypothetical protein